MEYKTHYKETGKEIGDRRAKEEGVPNTFTGCYEDNNLCGNGAFHAPRTRIKSQVTCPVCITLLGLSKS